MKDDHDWPPMRSAYDLPDGETQRGSTGQLFKVKDGRWVRISKEIEDKLDDAISDMHDMHSEDGKIVRNVLFGISFCIVVLVITLVVLTLQR